MGINTVRKPYLLIDDAAGDETGRWIPLDYRFSPEEDRSIHGTVTAGDNVIIEATTVRAKDRFALANIIEAADITVLQTYTEDFNDIINGQWTFVRARKTGSNGTSRVRGIL